MTDPDCTGFAATCAKCACVVRVEEEPDEGDETFCDACTTEIDLEYEREHRMYAQEELQKARSALMQLGALFTRMLAYGGKIVRATDLSDDDVALAKKDGRRFIDDDGYQFVYLDAETERARETEGREFVTGNLEADLAAVKADRDDTRRRYDALLANARKMAVCLIENEARDHDWQAKLYAEVMALKQRSDGDRESLQRWQARFAEAVIDGDRMRLVLHDLAFAAPTIGDEHRNAKGWLHPDAWGAYVSRVQKMAGGAIRRPASVCVACGCPAEAHNVDDEERRECEQCDGCKQYEVAQ